MDLGLHLHLTISVASTEPMGLQGVPIPCIAPSPLFT